MTQYLAGLSAALALDLTILFALVSARLWQCRAEYFNFGSAPLERQDVLVLMAGMFGFFLFADWQRLRATYAWWAQHWAFRPAEGQALVYLPIAIVSVWAMLWWAYIRVLGRSRGKRCWHYMTIITVIVGAVASL